MIAATKGLKRYAVLLLCGINLAVIQFIMIREITSILYGEELVIVLVSAAYFSGWSLGYLISDFLSAASLKFYAYLTLIFHLSLPWSIRFLTCRIYELGGRGWSLLCFLFVISFLISAFYSIFLPKFISEDSSPNSLRIMYTIGALGTVLGISLIMLISSYGALPLMIIYYFLLSVTVALLLEQPRVIIATGFIIFILALFWGNLKRSSTEYVYEKRHRYSNPKYVFSAYSPYQQIDIIKTGKNTVRLFLDGLQNFNSRKLTRINYFVAGLPARLYSSPEVLIMGSGSLTTVKYTAPVAAHVTVVEIDPVMAYASKEIFGSRNKISKIKNWNLVVDDGKHFLMNSSKKYDLIVMDIPSPYSIQEAILHSREFYKMAGLRLNDGGVISVHLSGRVNRSSTAVQVARALLEAFNDVYIVRCSGLRRDFGIAGNNLAFDADDIRAIIRKNNVPEKTEVLDRNQILEQLPEDGEAISIDNLEVVLKKGWARMVGRYF